MTNRKTGKFSYWLRAVAFAVLIAFTVNTLAWADGSGHALQSLQALGKENAPASPKDSLPDKTLISSMIPPQKLGQVKSFYQGTGDKLIIHIQDAHVNTEAQRRIA